MSIVLPPQKTPLATLQHLELDALVTALTSRYVDEKPQGIIQGIIEREFPGKVAVISSFGVESAVLLHMVAAVDPTLPIIFLDTLRHLQATLDYQKNLASHLGLRNIVVTRPDPAGIAAEDPDSRLAKSDPDRCCYVRKTLPMIRAVQPFACLLTGRKRFQSDVRAKLEPFEMQGRWVKANPLWAWSKQDLQNYFAEFALPPHPLERHGFASVGCEPCTTAVTADGYSRAGRWVGSSKTECGIHSGLRARADGIANDDSAHAASATAAGAID